MGMPKRLLRTTLDRAPMTFGPSTWMKREANVEPGSGKRRVPGAPSEWSVPMAWDRGLVAS